MKTKIIFFFLILTTAKFSVGQHAIDVTDQTLKIGGKEEEEMYFGFAEGDQIVFSFSEIDKKELKEIEIIEYPTSSKFSEYKTSKVENKTITVNKKAIYMFRFYNGAIGGRICKIKIQRIPANESTHNFNTNVSWITKQDTTWHTYTKDVIIGYDTTYEQKSKTELVKTEQKEELIFDKPQRVHSMTNGNGNKTFLFFSLPENQTTPNQTKKVTAWAYWIGVGDEANQCWKQNCQAIGTLAKGIATYYTTPLGALAVGAVADLMVPKIGEDVYYAISDEPNKNLFMAGLQNRVYDQGKGIAGYRKFTDNRICQGTYFICLSNDNDFLGIDASVKVIAIIEINTYEDKLYKEQRVTPKYEKKIFKEPILKTAKIPIIE